MKNNSNINRLLRKQKSLSERYHDKTKITKLRSVARKYWPYSWKNVYFKAYGRMPETNLPQPTGQLGEYTKILMNRKSERDFSKKSISRKQLSTLLYFSLGIKYKNPTWRGNRFYPSAGARYPIEGYILSLNTEISSGIYHYYIKNHSLESLGTITKKGINGAFDQKWIFNAGAIIVLSAQFNRTTIKYGDRGYRHVLIEAGHIGQNLYLTASAIGLACCAVGGYIDSEIEDILDIDGNLESVVYVIAVGSK